MSDKEEEKRSYWVHNQIDNLNHAKILEIHLLSNMCNFSCQQNYYWVRLNKT